MTESRSPRCTCGSGRPQPECCPDVPITEADLLSTDEVSAFYRQIEDLRRDFKTLVSARNPLESAVKPVVDRRLIEDCTPLPREEFPCWLGMPVSRALLIYRLGGWSDEKGGEMLDRLYALCGSFGDYMEEILGVPASTVAEYERVCEAFCDYLLMYYLTTPLEVKPGQDSIRRFLGNYYPRTQVDANLDFVFHALSALPAFYAWLGRLGFVTWKVVDAIVDQCRDWQWFRHRLLEFHELKGFDRADWCRRYDYKSMPVG
jgi:hypothetical protein